MAGWSNGLCIRCSTRTIQPREASARSQADSRYLQITHVFSENERGSYYFEFSCSRIRVPSETNWEALWQTGLVLCAQQGHRLRNFGNTKFWCHLSLESGEQFTNKEIRKSPPTKIPNFRELVKAVAKIANHNPDYSLYFRGQTRDYQLGSGSSSFYPTIFRSQGRSRSLTTKDLGERYRKLENCSNDLLTKLDRLKIDNINKLKKFPELTWSILQHYEVCGTPLLDFTHSLRVAASFALNDASDSANIFVFAFPYPNGTISYSTEEELLNVRLLSACPADALRPHFQEGYLLGSFPSRVYKKQPFLDFGRRLIAKFEIPKESFWGSDFHAIPNTALYPHDDEVEAICAEIKSKYDT